MRKKAEGKIKTWSPVLGDNGPKSVSDLIFPEASDINTLSVDGEKLEIITAPGLKDRGRYIWVPSLHAVFGGVAVFGGMYPWVVDLPTVEERNAWRAALDDILARKPKIVVPGHTTSTWPTDASSVSYTRDYLIAFDAEAAKAAASKALIAAMEKLYPNAAHADFAGTGCESRQGRNDLGSVKRAANGVAARLARSAAGGRKIFCRRTQIGAASNYSGVPEQFDWTSLQIASASPLLRRFQAFQVSGRSPTSESRRTLTRALKGSFDRRARSSLPQIINQSCELRPI
ncbi:MULTISPECIES: hypothetical protein [unclassified Rhizobium]|uniref:hypothetical protein n=1 Tax=unclassified Rhizobium TaxID=2613769 RepID=UPI001FD89B66|nr:MULTISPECIES: hypothetical protein [unclassified Rhizobium]